ncbi:MAG: tRNA (adenosine(37)-N6)-dimethylallyltransferase MiaA [Treponema sp.]|nr:tRNA (adenosine(37)-N6)-dimethylallyltransferase MiaA [Treponema sp.]
MSPKDRRPVVPVLFGPTASGKTALLSRLFGPGGLAVGRAEVVSADSMQVYRGMDIGTAKPGPAERAELPHHLIDIRDPDEQFNVGDFVRLATDAVAGILERGLLPIVAGGTGFYLRNLVLGLPESPPSDAAVRETLKAELAEKGSGELMAELAGCDPVSAGRIHRNDGYRLMRALEVFRLCGRPLSSFGMRPELPFRYVAFALCRPKAELYRRIGERCGEMFERGLPEEVAGLLRSGYGPADPGMRAIGYREFFVEDEPGSGVFRLSGDLAGVRELVATNSRRYAKRQLTYMASLPEAVPVDVSGDGEEVAGRLWREVSSFG